MLGLTAFDLYRPMLVGDAIDTFGANGDYDVIIATILSILSLMIVLWFGSRNVFDEIISVGTLYIFSNYIRSFFDPIQELAEQFSTLQSSIASAEKIFTVMDEDEFIPEVENPKQPDKITGKIELTMSGLPMTAKTMCLRMSHLS